MAPSSKNTSSTVSKRDRLILAVSLTLFFQFAQADAKDDPRSKTEGQVDVCIDCVVNAAMYGSSNLDDLKATTKSMAVFSKDPTGKTFIDPREVMDRNANPQLNAIGMITVSGKSTVPPRDFNSDSQRTFKPGADYTALGSGFLINECLVVTNHHVAFQDHNTKDFQASNIEFSSGISGNPASPFAFKSKGKVVSHGDYKANGDIKNDWAIIKLEKSVADPNNPDDARKNWKITPSFASFHDAGADSVSSASFYQDDEKSKNGVQLLGQKSCDIWARGKDKDIGAWKTDCAGIPGASGSPVFKEEKNSAGNVQLKAYGLMQSVRSKNEKELKATDQNFNNMIPFSEAMSPEKLQEIIKANPCTASINT